MFSIPGFEERIDGGDFNEYCTLELGNSLDRGLAISLIREFVFEGNESLESTLKDDEEPVDKPIKFLVAMPLTCELWGCVSMVRLMTDLLANRFMVSSFLKGE